ncbi:hypothetical protein SNE40_015145 [Patella caerulea]|uniref:Globin n=1 Tax=Patella caerulea TaxID=87958 RepID=A0AAN8JLK4_PATCE
MGASQCRQEGISSPVVRKLSKGSQPCKKLTQPVLTEEQKQQLQISWKIVKDDIANVGIFTFIALFENHPDIKHTFVSFRGLQPSELNNSSILRAHAMRLMTSVDKCLSRFDNMEKMEDMMKGLGERHATNYQVCPEHLDLMAPHFNYAIKNNLKNQWTPELEEAWDTLFKLMTYYMKEGMT